MRKALVIVAVLVLFVTAGWLTFHYDGRNASVNLDTGELRDDTQEALHSAEAAVERAAEQGKELIDDDRANDADQ